MGGSDVTARRMQRYITKAAERVAREVNWTNLRREQTFTTTAAYVQAGAIPSDFGRIVPETLWDRSVPERIRGPISQHEWQRLVANGIDCDRYYMVRGTDLMLYPAPDAGLTCAFEYVTNQWIESSGGAGQTAILADTDVPRMDEELIVLAAVADWLASEGQPHLAVERQYRTRLSMLADQDCPPMINYASDLIAEGVGSVGFPRGWSSWF